jgi:transaldolase/glucose-6-phosphate isomerase
MGGSSLAPEVFSAILQPEPDFPKLRVLDSTHPDEIQAMENEVDPSRCLFLVSSKSGTTLETMSLFRYFWEVVQRTGIPAGPHFMAVTDPGTPLEQLARQRGFQNIFKAPPDVGGRYSALSDFGMVPAALIGLDPEKILDSGQRALDLLASDSRGYKTPGMRLGALLGELGQERNKLTLITTPSLSEFPNWIEQLVAESTGKQGRGILPVVGERVMDPVEYSEDRIFVLMFLEDEGPGTLSVLAHDLAHAGHPVVCIHLTSRYALAEEMYNWELAVALASIKLELDPFDQPDVQVAKELAHQAMQHRGRRADSLEECHVEKPVPLAQSLEEFLEKGGSGDYISIQAYLPRLPDIKNALRRIRSGFQEATHLATTLGFGPRFLHSTGQLHKGGPEGGLYIQLVDEPEQHKSVPETDFSFNQLINAQSQGDYAALVQRHRRVLRLQLGQDRRQGLARLEEILSRFRIVP